MTDDFRTIMMRLQETCENGTIDEYIKCMIVDMSKKVVRNLLGNKFPEVRKAVETMMGGKVLDFEAKRIKDQAIKEGLEEGRASLWELIRKLFDAGRTSDVELASKDEEARKRFYKEFGMID